MVPIAQIWIQHHLKTYLYCVNLTGLLSKPVTGCSEAIFFLLNIISWACLLDCMKSVQIRSFFWFVFSRIRTEYGDLLRKSVFSLNTGKCRPEKTLYLDTFHAVLGSGLKFIFHLKSQLTIFFNSSLWSLAEVLISWNTENREVWLANNLQLLLKTIR